MTKAWGGGGGEGVGAGGGYAVDAPVETLSANRLNGCFQSQLRSQYNL